MDDVALVTATIKGDDTAFAALVQRYQVKVYNLAYRMVGPAEAEDAAQESFLRAYTQLGTYRAEYKFSSWMLAITAHYCIDVVRRRNRLAEHLPILAREYADEAAPEVSLVERESRLDVQKMVATLPPAHRVVIILHYWYDLSCAEIGEMLGLSDNCVRVRLHRARQLLAGKLRQSNRAMATGVAEL